MTRLVAIHVPDTVTALRVDPATGYSKGVELPVIDKRNRPLRDLRISVTDRCNFRCTYCMPKEVFGRDYVFLERSSILDFEEITRLARIFIGLGVTKVRITGGEPLVRRNVESLVRMLADLRPPLNSFPFREGVGVGSALHDLTLTTNGSLLAAKAQALKDAGLDRVTVSVDSLDDAIFRAMNDVDFPVATVLEGIDAAMAAGLPVKVNMVVRRGVNEESILPMARRFHGSGCILRFIEYMDVGSSNHWRPDEVVPASEIVRRIDAEMPVEPVAPNYAGEVARRFRYRDGGGEIGMIASVTQPFCGGCTRARLTADGLVYTCLFATSGHDVRTLLRSGVSDEVIAQALRDIWRGRSDRYSELRVTEHDSLPKVEMSRIGG